MKAKITLMAWTQPLIETIYCEWELSRSEGPVPTPQEVRQLIADERMVSRLARQRGVSREQATEMFKSHEFSVEFIPEDPPLPMMDYERKVRKVFEDCVQMKVPLAETVGFVFALENISISLREQLVRHRVGHKFGPNFAVGLMPDEPSSSYWSQSMRAYNVGAFAKNKQYLVPTWIEEHLNDQINNPGIMMAGGDKCTVETVYRRGMRMAEEHYRWLIEAGCPPEDARNLLPVGINHRLTWSCNLSSLVHLLSKRGCWIAQMDMWEPIVRGIVDELCTKVDPYFRTLIDPPCVSGNEFVGCKFHKENKEYIKGTDPHYPCPLWLHNHEDKVSEGINEAQYGQETWGWNHSLGENKSVPVKAKNASGGQITASPRRSYVSGERKIGESKTESLRREWDGFAKRREVYASLWGRDPYTGKRVRMG
jgi:hypothetical protein